MPIDDLTALGQKMREARKKKDLTQQELADLSHVSVKQIASIEKGQINPSKSVLFDFEGIGKGASALSGHSDQSRCFSRR